MYKIVNGIDILGRGIVKVAPSNYLRGHGKRIRKETCISDIKKYSFPYRSIEKWNKLRSEVIEAECVSQMKERFDKYRNGDRT